MQAGRPNIAVGNMNNATQMQVAMMIFKMFGEE